MSQRRVIERIDDAYAREHQITDSDEKLIHLLLNKFRLDGGVFDSVTTVNEHQLSAVSATGRRRQDRFGKLVVRREQILLVERLRLGELVSLDQRLNLGQFFRFNGAETGLPEFGVHEGVEVD